MILCDRVSKWYGGFRAVHEVSFELEPGRVAGLLGPNGAGKTTTIRMITGGLLPDAGTVRVAGFSVATHPLAARAHLGYLPESAPLYEEMRPRGYLRFRARLFGLQRRERERAIDKAMHACGLDGLGKKRIAALSKGYRQRVGIAAAILHDPSVLVLDEPTNGLDPTQIREARSLIAGLAQNRTVLVSSHILPEIERTCDRVLIIAAGRLLADGPPQALAMQAHAAGLHLVEVPRQESVALAEAIAARPGVAAVERQAAERSGLTRLLVRANDPSTDLREAIARAAQHLRVPIMELTRARPTLEDRFVELVTDAGGDRAHLRRPANAPHPPQPTADGATA